MAEYCQSVWEASWRIGGGLVLKELQGSWEARGVCEEALKPSSERGAARKPLKGGRGVVRCWARLRGMAAEGGWGQKAVSGSGGRVREREAMKCRRVASVKQVAIAQLAARRSHNPKVVSSILTCHILACLHRSRRARAIDTKTRSDPGRTRACNLWFRRPTPYPLGHRTSCRRAQHVSGAARVNGRDTT